MAGLVRPRESGVLTRRRRSGRRPIAALSDGARLVGDLCLSLRAKESRRSASGSQRRDFWSSRLVRLDVRPPGTFGGTPSRSRSARDLRRDHRIRRLLRHSVGGSGPPLRIRLFVALDLDAAARAACARVAERLEAAGCTARWIPPENYHVTVAFLGSIEDERLGAVDRALTEAVTALRHFRIPLERAGGYPNERRARIIWVGPHQPVAPFAEVCREVRGALRTAGFAFGDEHADAHVTIGRAQGVAVAGVAVTKTLVDADRLALYRSFTERAGARYVRLAEFAFGASVS
ncbi:MAG: RNA 2',3'-cyclic phosphodiesterase [Candidatus Eremiobacteraeota bacterium]|nr:RNA 2',3'-cyclic phosphodiesterase [Candidatus Eremiobacteraeota bacterium]